MASELVCGADFSCKLMCGAGPGDLGGARGSASAENPGKTGPKISSQTAFGCPVSQSHGSGAEHPAVGPRQGRSPGGVAKAESPAKGGPRPRHSRRVSRPQRWSLRAGSGYLKAVWLENFGTVLPGFSAEADPRNPPRSPGLAPHIHLHEQSAPRTDSN